MPPYWLIRIAVAGVWLYEGLWCKLLRGEPREFEVVKAVPRYGERFGVPFLLALGAVEVTVGLWVLTGIEPLLCAGSWQVDDSARGDGWTVVTVDGRLAVHYEHTVVVTADGPAILTRLED